MTKEQSTLLTSTNVFFFMFILTSGTLRWYWLREEVAFLFHIEREGLWTRKTTLLKLYATVYYQNCIRKELQHGWLMENYIMQTILKFKWNYNHGHNILRLFGTLSNFLFTTKETKHGYYNKHGIWKLRHELPKDLRLTIRSGNQKRSTKSQCLIEL